MAVQTVTDSPKRGGGWRSERKGPVFELVNRRYKRTQIVVCDDVADGPEIILASGAVPSIGSSYSLGNDGDAIAVCVDQEVEATESPYVWRVVSTYDSSRTVDLLLTNPLNLPAEVTWDFVNYEFPLVQDAQGIPLVNSSNERFDPPLTIEDSRPTLTVSRNEASYNEANAIAYQNMVNTDVFGPAQPLQAKITHITGQRMVDIGIVYWKVTYQVEFRWQTFAMFVLDQGFRDATGKLFRDPIDWSPLANPTLLNGRGFRMVDSVCQVQVQQPAAGGFLIVENLPTYTGTQQPGGYFPPGPKLGTPQWYFNVKVDDEIQTVVGGFGNQGINVGGNGCTWNVIRGANGTAPAQHNAGAQVFLQPYFLRFIPFRSGQFAPLNLPTS